MKENDNIYEALRQKYLRMVRKYKKMKANPKTAALPSGRPPRWTEKLLQPLLKELIRCTPEITWHIDEDLHPLGLRGDCFILGKTENGCTVGLTFSYDNEAGILYYDTGAMECRYAPETIGALNRFNNVCAPVKSLEMLLDFIHHQCRTFDFLRVASRVRCTARGLEGEYTVAKIKYRPGDERVYYDTVILITDGMQEYKVYPDELKPIE